MPIPTLPAFQVPLVHKVVGGYPIKEKRLIFEFLGLILLRPAPIPEIGYDALRGGSQSLLSLLGILPQLPYSIVPRPEGLSEIGILFQLHPIIVFVKSLEEDIHPLLLACQPFDLLVLESRTGLPEYLLEGSLSHKVFCLALSHTYKGWTKLNLTLSDIISLTALYREAFSFSTARWKCLAASLCCSLAITILLDRKRSENRLNEQRA